MSVTTTLAACSTTPASNGPDGTVDAPSTLDDAIRYALSFVAIQRDDGERYATSVAGTNTITGSLLGSAAAYATGKTYAFIPANANTGATTLNLSSIGAKSIFRNGAALVGGELQASRPALVTYDGTQFHLINPSPFISGQILQELVFTDAGTTTASATLASVTLAAKSITPKSSNSTLVIECSFNGQVTAAGPGLNSTASYRLYNNTGAADIGAGEITLGAVSTSGANLQTQVPCSVRATLANSGTTAIAFVLRARYATASATVSGTAQQWTIREIQN